MLWISRVYALSRAQSTCAKGITPVGLLTAYVIECHGAAQTSMVSVAMLPNPRIATPPTTELLKVWVTVA
jgi:hypothetical protein